MATRTATLVPNPSYLTKDAVKIYEWSGLLNNDVGSFLQIPAHSDITVSTLTQSPLSGVAATAFTASAVVTWEGSLDDTATATNNNCTLHKPDGSNLTQNAVNLINQCLEHPVQIRPKVTGGDGSTTVSVRAVVNKQWVN